MRVLVTGGLGFIGQHVTEELLDRGDDVTILDARTEPVHDPAAPRIAPPGARVVEGSVTSAEALDDALTGVDAVIHLAAYQDYMPDTHRFFDVNTSGTALLLERILERAPNVSALVYASSQAVYGEGAVGCPRDGLQLASPRRDEDLSRGILEPRCSLCDQHAPPAATPEAMTAPTNAYGMSKLAGEKIALTLGAQAGIRGVALRYAIVHGEGQSPRNAYSGILRAALVRAIEGKRPIVFEDGLSLRDYVDISAVVRATLLALDDERASGAYNVGGARSWTVLELLAGVSAATGSLLKLDPEIPGWYRVGDVRHTIGDLTRLTALGWHPTDEHDLSVTWESYLDWLEQNLPPKDTVDRAIDLMLKKGVLRPMSGSATVRAD